MKKRIFSFIMAIIFLVILLPCGEKSVKAASGTLHVNGIDALNNASSLPVGVTIEEKDGQVILTLDNAKINEGFLNGSNVGGIYAQNLNLTVNLINNNTINIIGQDQSKSYNGIVVSRGNLIITGMGTLNVTGQNRSIHGDGQDSSEGNISFTNNVKVDAYGEMKSESSLETGATIYIKDTANVTANSETFAKNIIKDDTATFVNNGTQGPGGNQPPQPEPLGPATFNIGANEYVIDDKYELPKPEDHNQPSEVILESGEGFEIVAVGGWDDMMNDWNYNYNLKLNNYNGGSIRIQNVRSFLILNGVNNINKNEEGYSIVLDNSGIQVWEDLEAKKPTDKPIINLVGGINLIESEFNAWYTGSWHIGTTTQYSPKGIVGEGIMSILQITKDTFTIYSSEVAVKGIDKLIVEDGGSLNAITNNNAIENLNQVQVSTAGKIDITYKASSSVVDNPSIQQLSLIYKSANPESQEVFPVSKQYYINCKNNTYAFSKADFWSEPDETINGQPVELDKQKYILKDENLGENRHYTFTSTANRITRVFADDAGTIVGGTLKVKSINGYDYGGYVAEVGSTVTVELLPDVGYQYKKGTLGSSDSGVELVPTEDPAVYTFIMPEGGIALACEFEKTDDIVSSSSNSVPSVTAVVPTGEVKHGNYSFNVSDAEISTATEQDIEDAAGEKIVGAYLDLSLNEVINKDGSKEDVWKTPLTELTNKVTVNLSLESELQGKTEYSIIRVHNGETNILEASYTNGVLSFETDRFSSYAIAYSEPKPEEVLLESIELNKSKLDMKKGDNETLIVTYNPENTTVDKNITWSTSDDKVVTVDETGKITAVNSGSATITAKVGDFVANCIVNVAADSDVVIVKEVGENKVSITAKPGVIEEGTIVDIKSIVADEDAKKLIVTSLGDGYEQFIAFDINLLKGEVKVQPNGYLTISIAVPSGFDKSKLAVFRVNEDGTKVQMQGQVVGDEYVFETNHFSNYVLAEAKSEVKEQVNENNLSAVVNTENTNKVTSTKTSDNAQVEMWIILSMISVGIILVGVKRRKAC